MSDVMTKGPTAPPRPSTPAPSKATGGSPGVFDEVYGWLTKKDPAKQQRKQQKKQDELAVKDAGYLKKYEDALTRAEAAQTALEQMNRSREFLDKVKVAIAGATTQAAAGQYKAGFDILAAAKIDAELKKAKAAHAQSLVDGRAGFPDAFVKADRLRAAAEAASVLTEAEKQDFVQRADEAIAPLSAPAPQVREGVEAGKVLDAAHQELTGRIAVCTEAKRAAAAALQDLERFEKSEAATLPADYLAEFQYKLTQGRTQFEGGGFEAASVGLELLQAEATLRQKQANEDWDRLQAKLGVGKKAKPKRPSILDPGMFEPPTEEELSQPEAEPDQQPGFATAEIDRLLVEARALRDRAIKKGDEIPPLEAEPPTASGTVNRLLKLREASVKGEIGTTMTAGDALAEFDACEAEIALNKGRVVKYKDAKLVAARQAIQEVVDDNSKKIAVAFTNLKKAAAKLRPQDTDLGKLTATFEAEFNRLVAAWQKQKNAATEVFQLYEPDIGKQLRELRLQVRSVYRADDNAVVANVQTLADEAQKRELDAAIEGCASKIDQIVALSLQKGLAADDTYQAIKRAAAGAKDPAVLSQCAADLATLSRQVDSWIQEETTAAAALSKDIKAKLADAKAKLAQLSTLVIREKAQEDYLGLEQRFADEIAAQELLSGNGDKTVLQDVLAALTKTVADITKAIAAVNGEKGGEETLYTNEDARQAIKKRRDKLLDKTLTTYLPARQVELRDGMDTIEEDLAARLPQETYEKLQAWDVERAAAQTAAETAKNEIVTLTAKVDRVKVDLADPAFAKTKGYRDTLTAKLDACIEAARTSGDLVAAEKTLSEVAGEITTAKADPQKVADGQVAVDQAAQQAKVDQAEWQGYLTAFEARVTKQTGWRSTQRDELQKLAKQADQVFKKSGDVAAARKQLATAGRRADYYRDYPDGQDVALRAKLPKLVNACGTAFKALRAEMKAVGEAVGALTELTVDDKKIVEDEIAALVNEFNIAMLTPVAAQMNEKGRDKRAMRAVRETGLREVGRMLAVLEDDLRCQVMMTNPFSPGVKNVIVAARLALLKVEYTLQTSL